MTAAAPSGTVTFLSTAIVGHTEMMQRHGGAEVKAMGDASWRRSAPSHPRWSEQLLQMTKRLPLPRGGDPAEVAEAYLYLMRGTYTTGQVLRVDGGYTLI